MLTQTEKNALLQPIQDYLRAFDERIKKLEDALIAQKDPVVEKISKDSKKAA